MNYMVSSLHETAKYTRIHIRCILISGKYQHLATLGPEGGRYYNC